MGFYLSSTTPVNTLGVANPVRLQQYLPPANTIERGFKAFTAYDKDTKTFTTVAADFPSPQTMTVWTSTISGTDVATVSNSISLFCFYQSKYSDVTDSFHR